MANQTMKLQNLLGQLEEEFVLFDTMVTPIEDNPEEEQMRQAIWDFIIRMGRVGSATLDKQYRLNSNWRNKNGEQARDAYKGLIEMEMAAAWADDKEFMGDISTEDMLLKK